MRGRRSLRSSLLLATVVALSSRAGAGEPEPLRIEASVVAPGASIAPTRVVVEESGRATVVRAAIERSPEVTLAFELTTAEVDRLRRAVDASRFLEDWGPDLLRIALHQPEWNVVVALGGRERRRPDAGRYAPFDVLAQELFRFVRQADLVAELRAGNSYGTRRVLERDAGAGVLRPDDLAPEIVGCVVRTTDEYRSGLAAAVLVRLPSVEAWLRSARDVLGSVSGERRGAVLGTWAVELRAPDRAAHRAAFVPTAVAEIEASTARWPSMAERELVGHELLLASLLEDRVPRAFDLAETVIASRTAPDRPYVPSGLVETGADAVPVAVRLLAAEEIRARIGGATLTNILASRLRRKGWMPLELTAEARAAAERRFEAELVPALERSLADRGQPYRFREICAEALDAWDGRVRAAQTADREAAETARRRDEERRPGATPPPVAGTLAISGRISVDGAPLPGFGIFAVRDDGRSERSATTDEHGAFVVEGLAEGTYDLFDSRPGEGLGGVRRGGPRAARGVVAGTAGLDLRLPGTLIRGRLVGRDGAPARGRRILARMRDGPTVFETEEVASDVTDTDAEGRFWFIRLLRGTYDLQVLGEPVLRGGAGVVAGPEERRVEILPGGAVAGRVVDEDGVPLPGVGIAATVPGRPWETVQAAKTGDDGAFRLGPVDPERRYDVSASFTFLGGDGRGAIERDVAPGTELVFRIDTSPRIRLRVARGPRRIATHAGIRLTRAEGGEPVEHTFDGEAVDWRMAKPGTWKVSALAADVDTRGVRTFTWVDLGTVRPGDPERTFDVPR